MGKRANSPPPVDDTDDEFVRFLEYVRLHPSRALERKARLYAAYLHRSRKPLIQFSLRTLFVSTSVLAFLMGLHQFDEPLFYFLGFLVVVVPIIACVLYAPIVRRCCHPSCHLLAADNSLQQPEPYQMFDRTVLRVAKVKNA